MPQYYSCPTGGGIAKIVGVLLNYVCYIFIYRSAGQAVSSRSSALTGKRGLCWTSISDSESVFSMRYGTSQNCESYFPTRKW